MTIAIKIENLSKHYRLGLVSTRTLSHDLNRWYQTTIRGKEDPYLKIGESARERGSEGARERRSDTRDESDSIPGQQSAFRIPQSAIKIPMPHALCPMPSSDYIWALRDINLEVSQGEVLGIIGKNGAGKSTLLKILSKVTAPTTGTIKAKGRIASLLEVGTGFHPEMTGRENIFMNGAIMGMSKAEITHKLDEIIDFAGVEQFIDTPVKRYSSGMTVRLGFAVAAHLEPEILVVDEVLAVGDAEFQKKAIGKMQEVSRNEGRTVLFVSHNMAAILNLCKNSILLNNGIIQFRGDANDCVNAYVENCNKKASIDLMNRIDRTGAGSIKFKKVSLLNKNREIIQNPKTGEDLIIRIFYDLIIQKDYKNCRVSCAVYSQRGLMFVTSTEMVSDEEIRIDRSGYFDLQIKDLPLSKGTYFLTLFVESNGDIHDSIDESFYFEVVEGDFFGFGRNYPKGWEGNTVLIKHEFVQGSE